MFYIVFCHVKSPKASMYFTVTANLHSDEYMPSSHMWPVAANAVLEQCLACGKYTNVFAVSVLSRAGP